MNQREVTREISYATAAKSAAGRTMIRVIENATGRIKLIKRAKDYDVEVAQGRNFWDVMVDRYGLTLDVYKGSLANIPSDGPLVLISNHPYGILDGLVMGHVLSQARRGDFQIMAHTVFRKAEDITRHILPIDFSETREALKLNLNTRKEALRYLGAGGAVGIFPGGTVSTSIKPFVKPMDPVWRSFTTKMVAKSGATVVPMFFDGNNSQLFQLASHAHYNLRVALLIREFRRRIDEPVRLAVGEPISPEVFQSFGSDSRGLMEFLRDSTYALSSKQEDTSIYGMDC